MCCCPWNMACVHCFVQFIFKWETMSYDICCAPQLDCILSTAVQHYDHSSSTNYKGTGKIHRKNTEYFPMSLTIFPLLLSHLSPKVSISTSYPDTSFFFLLCNLAPPTSCLCLSAGVPISKGEKQRSKSRSYTSFSDWANGSSFTTHTAH